MVISCKTSLLQFCSLLLLKHAQGTANLHAHTPDRHQTFQSQTKH
jgi:hypothetical protein